MRSLLIAGMFLLSASASQAQFRQSDPIVSCLPPELKGLLLEIDASFGPITVVSGERSGELTSILRVPSKHSQCKAVDITFKTPDRKADAGRWLMKQPYEVIVYSGRMEHIHIAIGVYKTYRVIGPRATQADRPIKYASY